jgi:hypothetical protein
MAIVYLYILYKDAKFIYKNTNIYVRTFMVFDMTVLMNVFLNMLFDKIGMKILYEISDNFIESSHILLYWVIIVIVGVGLIEYISDNFNVSKIIKRKLFHFLALAIFYPGIIYLNKMFMLFISIVVLFLFIAIELIRNKFRNKYTDIITQYLKSNIDSRDDEKFIITHILLLYSSFSSLIYQTMYFHKDELKYTGLITLCIGDAFVNLHNIGCYNRFKIRKDVYLSSN